MVKNLPATAGDIRDVDSIPGILQARTLEWAAISFSNLDSILKSRDITLLTNFCLVKAMVFQ